MTNLITNNRNFFAYTLMCIVNYVMTGLNKVGGFESMREQVTLNNNL